MNQILSVDDSEGKKKKKNKKVKTSSGPADIKTVVKVFATTMIIFGAFIIGTGSYAIYKENESSASEVTKPVISETLSDDGTSVILTVTHDKEIDRIEYSWNNGEVETITGNGRQYIEEEIEIPGGTNTLYVTAYDTQGQEISSQKEFTVEDNMNLNLTISENSKLQITAESETEISYMTYRWDDEEEQTIEINSTTVDEEIDVPMGTHEITVILVDVNNETTMQETTVVGTTKPEIEIETDDSGEYYLITITDEVGLERVELTFRDEERTIEIEDGQTEVKYKLQLNEDDENKLEITAYNIDGIASDTKKVKAQK